MIYELELSRENLHGHFSRDLEPVLTIDPGDSVRLSTPNAGWYLDSGEELAPRDPVLDGGHALAGPIAVRGARAGQVLAVRIDDVVPGAWGITPTSGEHAVTWELADGVGRASTGHLVDLRPFLGVIGMPPAERGIHTTTPPRPHGGNIDCKELVAGTTLYLPIPVDRALFSAGDGHALQGDGEVCGTAIECPTRAELTIGVRDDLTLDLPCARVDGAWLTFGFDEHLGLAAQQATGGMVALMGREHGLAPDDALALASVAVDLRVTQVVNETLGVHAVLRDDALR